MNPHFVVAFFALATSLRVCDCVHVYSSFWAPIFNPSILNYRVDANFDPNSGKNAKSYYEDRYGYRGANLIADLGNGKPPNSNYENKLYGDVKFYYTANNDGGVQ